MKSRADQYADAIMEAGFPAVPLLIKHLRASGELPMLPAIARAVEAAERASRDQYVVTSARPLSAAMRKQMNDLVHLKNAELTEVVDPTLIGGVRIRLRDDRYDASVSGSLKAIRYAMKAD